MKNDRDTALRAVGRIQDPDVLQTVLRTEPPKQDKGIRALVVVEAAKKFGDEQRLYEMAADQSHSLEWRGYDVKHRAVDALRDQALLARLLMEIRASAILFTCRTLPNSISWKRSPIRRSCRRC